MRGTPVRKMQMTTKRYTVEFSQFDPPCPVCLSNTNSLRRAKELFGIWKQEEINEARESGTVGGCEWDLAIYEHNENSTFEPHYDDDEEFTDTKYIYWVNFPNSKVLDQIGYCSDEIYNAAYPDEEIEEDEA